MKVKICGITDIRTAKIVCEYGADAIGFVFAKSKRKITPDQAKQMIEELPENVMKVGVFVNESIELIQNIVTYCGLTHVQLHGDEQNYHIKRLNIPCIKAIGVSSREDIERAEEYETDFILFDSPKEQFHGGNGKTFSWELLRSNPIGKKCILAGGLQLENIAEAIEMVQPYMVDVSSGVETNGKKDIEKIKKFITKAKEC
ncbi:MULTISPECIES: phosphoribosylanthranilate isomerase [unclassified Bacillus (in: firmicutes)]|uniref:phosphoribosylanthranilate isomerase n=1 Tax=unclassified Bacillus (in: firmicutes) TaxID=185979 RepID=UPI0008E5FC86|nr:MULTISPECIES: phosphoribosylanthranilate isomerase [unclassified Bacillus (in: firmicutes)]SFI89868.1 phosphoribosylanthranilate isomerase [Bacillus sp. 71mf]SFS66602.1 phosphoribosylanthranilate isomerase [Bacillus sp. 103mf]